MLRIEIPSNNIIRVYGPAAITVVKGSIDVLGKRFSSGEKLVVHKVRSYPLIALEDTVIEANLGVEARIEEASSNEPLIEWMDSVEKILSGNSERIVVIGPIDSGKSTYTLLLANKALDKGFNIAIIDSDVGQADIGPPCFITLSIYKEKAIWMKELKPDAMKFIGDIRPQYHVDKIVYGIRELLRYAIDKYGVNIAIVDTDGWVGDINAVEYKTRILEAIDADTVVVLDSSLHGIFKFYEKTSARVYELSSPQQARPRSREVRRKLRSEQYRRFLENVSVKRYSMDEVVLTSHPMFYGVEIDPSNVSSIAGVEVLYATKTIDTLFLVTNAHPKSINGDKLKSVYKVSRIRLYSPGFEKNILVGLSDGTTDYPGLIAGIDYSDKSIAVKTGFDGVPKYIRFSRIRLTDEYHEQIIEHI